MIDVAPPEALSPDTSPVVHVWIDPNGQDSRAIGAGLAERFGGKVLDIVGGVDEVPEDGIALAAAVGLEEPLPTFAAPTNSATILLRLPEDTAEEDGIDEALRGAVEMAGARLREVMHRPPTILEEEMTPERRARREADERVWGGTGTVQRSTPLPDELLDDD